jgi:hypothetical protein
VRKETTLQKKTKNNHYSNEAKKEVISCRELKIYQSYVYDKFTMRQIDEIVVPLRSVNGPQFISHLFENACETFGMIHERILTGCQTRMLTLNLSIHFGGRML